MTIECFDFIPEDVLMIVHRKKLNLYGGSGIAIIVSRSRSRSLRYLQKNLRLNLKMIWTKALQLSLSPNSSGCFELLKSTLTLCFYI